MAEIVNLRRARKARARIQDANEAAVNRVRFGRTRAQKHLDRSIAEREARHLDARRLDSTHDSTRRR